jgi:methyl-accepting chemotaxis protein
LLAYMSLKSRLMAAFGCMALVGAVSGAAAVIGLRKVDVQASVLYEKHLLGLSAIKEAEIHLIQVARFRAQFARAGDAASRDKYRKLFEEHLQAAQTALAEAAPRLVTERDQMALQNVQAKLVAYAPHGRAFLDAVASTEPPVVSPEIKHLNETAIDSFQSVTQGIDVLAKHKEEVGAVAARDVNDTYLKVRWIVVVVSFVTATLALMLGRLLASRVAAELGGEPEAAARIARDVTSGDLTRTIQVEGSANNSVMAAMREMQARLSDVVGGIRTAADSIATASSQIAAGNADLSHRTEQQAASLQQTASTMDELAGTVRNNANTAMQAADMAAKASEVAVQGGEAVSRVVATMTDISESSRKISDIIGVIDGIAFQTNILALNAAVEAARAGEQGRGFAVVASEVRSLAQRSSEAAREIKSLILASAERVEAGSVQVQSAGRTMNDIVDHVHRVSELLDQISVATREQTAGISQVGESVSRLDQVTQQNAALVEESAAAAESLQLQATELVRSVSQFRLSREPG